MYTNKIIIYIYIYIIYIYISKELAIQLGICRYSVPFEVTGSKSNILVERSMNSFVMSVNIVAHTVASFQLECVLLVNS